MNRRDDYHFDPIVSEIIDNPDNGISLSSIEKDPIFGYLQTNSTLEDFQYVLENELLLEPACDPRLTDKPQIRQTLINYALQKIQERLSEQSWLSRKFSAFGTYLNSVLNNTFLSIFGFEGYNPVTTKVMTALGGEQPFSGRKQNPICDKPKSPHSSPLLLYLASFFGLPSRPSGLNPDENDQLDWDQLKRNFIGGWNPFNQPSSKGYIIYSIAGDGDCGFSALGITRKEAIVLLSTDKNIIRVKPKLQQLFCEYLVEETNYYPFYDYLVKKGLLNREVSVLDLMNHRADYSADNRFLRAFIQFDYNLRRRWAHPILLQSVSELLDCDLHIWRLGDKGQLLPNYECAHNRKPSNSARKDILFVNYNHFERLELVGYPKMGPPDDEIIYNANRWSAKKIIELLLFPLKLLVIFPLKILLIIPKFLINVVKLVTEFIPNILSILLNDAKKSLQKKQAEAFTISRLKDFGINSLIVVCTFFSVFFTLWFLLGRTVTSPLTSASRAYFYFSQLDSVQISIFGRGFQKGFAKIIGLFFMLVSVAFSITFWTLLLPFALSAFAPYGAAIIQSASTTFPMITKALTTLSQLPAVSTTLQAISTAFTTVGTYLSSSLVLSTSFNVITSALSVQIPAALITAGVAMGTLLVPLVTFSSWVADKMSDLWAHWGGYNEDTLQSMNNTKEEIVAFEEAKIVETSKVKRLVQEGCKLQEQAINDASFVPQCEELPYGRLFGMTDLDTLKELSNPLSESQTL